MQPPRSGDMSRFLLLVQIREPIVCGLGGLVTWSRRPAVHEVTCQAEFMPRGVTQPARPHAMTGCGGRMRRVCTYCVQMEFSED